MEKYGAQNLSPRKQTLSTYYVPKTVLGVRIYYKQITISSQRDESPMNLQNIYEITVKINPEIFLFSNIITVHS